MNCIATQTERKDLPLVVIPSVATSMVSPLEQQLTNLENVARVRLYTDTITDEDEFAARCEDASAVIVIGFHISDSLLERLAGHVRCFIFGGTGVASYINLDRCAALGIRVCNTVHYGDSSVAEFAFALIMEIARHVGSLNASVHSGLWEGSDGFVLEGRKLGIVGFGGIGQAMARIAHGFNMNILVWNSHLHSDAVKKFGVVPVDTLSELFSLCDIVSVHLPLNNTTSGTITAKDLKSLKPGAMLINTARAEVIEPGALAARLSNGDIYAGLDVFDTEPLPDDDPLRTMRNVVLTPHDAWLTDQAYANIAVQLMQSTRSFFTGRPINVMA